MRSRSLLLALAAASALAGTPVLGKPICRDCNVILVTIDVWRADELTSGGSARVIMPHLEALASKGVAFANVYSPSSGTTPADLSILSGLYQWHHGVDVPLRDKSKKDEWARSGRTLPALLRGRGYEVYAGDLGSTDDLNRMLDRELAVAGKAPRPEDVKQGGKFFMLLRGSLHDPYFPEPSDVKALAPEVAPDQYPTSEDVLRCDYASLLARKPPASLRFPREGTDFWFQSDADRRTASEIVDSDDPSHRLEVVHRWNPLAATYTLNSQCFWSFFSSATIQTARLLYDASARRVDRILGDLLGSLAAKGLLKNTLIVVTAQHGEAFLEHGYINHSSRLHTEVLHVPLVFSAPSLKGGLVVPDVVRSIDIMPTILDALGERLPPDLDGKSLLPCLAGRCPKSLALAYYDKHFGIRDDRYSFLSGTEPDELYDRRTDPKEQVNIAQKDPETSARYKALLEKNIKDSDLVKIREGIWPDWVDDNMREQIIRTGYW